MNNIHVFSVDLIKFIRIFMKIISSHDDFFPSGRLLSSLLWTIVHFFRKKKYNLHTHHMSLPFCTEWHTKNPSTFDVQLEIIVKRPVKFFGRTIQTEMCLWEAKNTTKLIFCVCVLVKKTRDFKIAIKFSET